MAFRVGQRIKNVRGTNNVGATGTVVAVGFFPKGSRHQDTDVTGADRDLIVEFDGPWRNTAGRWFGAEVHGYCTAHYWEPLTPPGICEQIRAMENLPEFNCPVPVAA